MRIARRTLLGICCSLLFAGGAIAEPAHPPLYRIVKGQSTVYLMGSMHFLMPSDYPLPADVDNAYLEADKLYFELPPGDMQSAATMLATMQLGTYHDAHTLQADVTPELWKRILDYSAKNGLPQAAVARFEPWFLAIAMVGIESQKMGMTGDSGLDMHFAKRAEGDHKPVGGFETVVQQLSIFHDAPTKVQVEFLKQGFDELPDFRKDMEREHDLWRRGDVDAMIARARKEFADYPELYKTMVSDRNRAWVPKIEKELDGGKHETLVIVGALHLAGNDGVVSLLKKDGYAVERICTGCKRAP